MTKTTKKIIVYRTRTCPYCIRATRLLDQKGWAYEEIFIEGQPEKRQAMQRLSGRYTVPQIWIGDKHIGGCDELFALDDSGELDKLL